MVLNPYFKDEILSFMPLISVGLWFRQRGIMLEQNGDVKQYSVITIREFVHEGQIRISHPSLINSLWC